MLALANLQGNNFLQLVGSLEGPNQLCSLESIQERENNKVNTYSTVNCSRMCAD